MAPFADLPQFDLSEPADTEPADTEPAVAEPRASGPGAASAPDPCTVDDAGRDPDESGWSAPSGDDTANGQPPVPAPEAVPSKGPWPVPELGSLAGAIAHDLNNILVGVVGNASYLAEQVDAGSGLRRPVRDLEASARKAALLIEQVLACAGPEAAESGPVDPLAVLRALRPLLQVPLPQGAMLELQLPEALPWIRETPAHVRATVLRMVVQCAAQLAGGPGVIRITAREQRREDHSEVVLQVRHNGSPRPRSLAAPSLEPVGDARMEQGEDGTWVQATWAGCDAQQDDGVAAPLGLHWNGRRRALRLLVVDDEADVRLAVRRMAEVLGCEVATAEDGFGCLTAIQDPHRAFDAVVLDLAMPGMDGAQTLRAIRCLPCRVPVLMMTGDAGGRKRLAAAADPDTRVLLKPFDLTSLATHLDHLVPERAGGDEGTPVRGRLR